MLNVIKQQQNAFTVTVKNLILFVKDMEVCKMAKLILKEDEKQKASEFLDAIKGLDESTKSYLHGFLLGVTFGQSIKK